jgi:outer membrane protein TolC
MPRSFLLLVVVTMWASAVEAPVSPPPPDATTALEQFRAVLANAPAIAAARSRVTAAEQAQGAAGVLPDPMVGADLGRERPRMGEDMTMYGAMVEQTLPRWGERDAMRQNARAQVGRESADVAAVIGEHAAIVASGLAEYAAARDTLVLIQQSQERIAALQDIMRSRIAAGGAMIGEQLALDSRAQQLAVQLADLERRGQDALAMVHGRLGLPPDAPLPPFAAPDPATIEVEGNPMARSAAAMQLEAQAMEREALARGNPETAVGLVWEREAAGTEAQTDKLSLTFRMSLPVYRSAYRDAADAARTRARAAQHEAMGATWMARSQITRAQRAVTQAELAQRTADDIAARTRTTYDAVIRQVGSGGASVTVTLDLLEMISESGRGAIMARLDSRMALAELWRLAPPDLPIVPAHGHADDHHQPTVTP